MLILKTFVVIVGTDNVVIVDNNNVVISASDTQSDGGEDSPDTQTHRLSSPDTQTHRISSPDTNQTHRLSSPDTNQTPDIVRTSLYHRNNVSGMIIIVLIIFLNNLLFQTHST